MATRKDNFLRLYYKYALYFVLNTALCSLLVALRYKCMDARNATFKNNYCLSDSHMRTVVSSILTVITYVIASQLVPLASLAYRTCKLKNGITEGVYIAIGCNNTKYRALSFKTRWFIPIAIVVIFTNITGPTQPLSTLALKTVGVYIQNNSGAVVFNNTSLYNATSPVLPIGLSPALEVVSLLREYSNGANSFINYGQVTTSVIRQGFVGDTSIISGDSSNSFRRDEVIAKISTNCTDSIIPNTLLSVLATPQEETINITAGGIFASTIYDLNYSVQDTNKILFSTTTKIVNCTNCVPADEFSVVAGIQSFCLSQVQLNVHNIIYTVATANITDNGITSNNTTVDINAIAQLISNYSKSIEGAFGSVNQLQGSSLVDDYKQAIIGISSSFEQGLFNQSIDNFSHSRIAASASLGLNFLWTTYGGGLSSGNDYLKYDTFVSLYNIVLQTYMPIGAAIGFAGGFVLITTLFCVVGVVYTAKCCINIRDPVDSSFVYNLDNDSIIRYRNEESNDPAKQMKSSFNNTLYLWEEPFAAGSRVMLGHIESTANKRIPSPHPRTYYI